MDSRTSAPQLTWMDAAGCRPGAHVVVWVTDGQRIGLAVRQHGQWCMVGPDPEAAPIDPVTHWAYLHVPRPPMPGALRLVQS